MSNIDGDNFKNEVMYRLFRSVEDLISPTISKRNISNYKVILDVDVFPILTFYPKKVSNISKVNIFIPSEGNISGSYGKYFDICSGLAKKNNSLVIAIDYFNDLSYPKSYDEVFKTVKYLIDKFVCNGIILSDITLISDSIGCNMMSYVLTKLIDSHIYIDKCIMIYPIVHTLSKDISIDTNDFSINDDRIKMIDLYSKKVFKNRKGYVNLLCKKYIDKLPKFLIVTGSLDVFRNEGLDLYNSLNEINDRNSYSCIKSASHGFLNGDDEVALATFYNEMEKFLED